VRIDNMVRTQNIEVQVKGNKLEDFRGSGLCISSQAGSTAYNRAIKGAVVERGLEVMQLAEIAGVHNVHYRSLGAPLILSGNNTISLYSDFDETSLLCFDRYAINLKGVTAVDITLAEESFKLARYDEFNYIKHFSQLF
ncbi:MAG: NAD(+)/NADH kinase, partial [Erysipelotrichaceae bacterium]|nr:NAD(+)/NADH kinase [Erysipelotrichaceae bacterium]